MTAERVGGGRFNRNRDGNMSGLKTFGHHSQQRHACNKNLTPNNSNGLYFYLSALYNKSNAHSIFIGRIFTIFTPYAHTKVIETKELFKKILQIINVISRNREFSIQYD